MANPVNPHCQLATFVDSLQSLNIANEKEQKNCTDQLITELFIRDCYGGNYPKQPLSFEKLFAKWVAKSLSGKIDLNDWNHLATITKVFQTKPSLFNSDILSKIGIELATVASMDFIKSMENMKILGYITKDNSTELGIILAENHPWLFYNTINGVIRAGLITKENVSQLSAFLTEQQPWSFYNQIDAIKRAGLITKENAPLLGTTLAKRDPLLFCVHIKAIKEAGLINSDNAADIVNNLAKNEPHSFCYHITAIMDAGLITDDNSAQLCKILANLDPSSFCEHITAIMDAGLITNDNAAQLSSSLSQLAPTSFCENIRAIQETGLIITNDNSPKLCSTLIRLDPCAFCENILAIKDAGLITDENAAQHCITLTHLNPLAFLNNIYEINDAGMITNENVSQIMTVLLNRDPQQYITQFDEVANVLSCLQIDRDSLLKQKSCDGLTALDFAVLPPAQPLKTIKTLIPSYIEIPPSFSLLIDLSLTDVQLANTLFQRIVERTPNYFRNLQHPDPHVQFIKTFIHLKTPHLMEVLSWDFKMNQSLPLTSECIECVSQLFKGSKDDESLLTKLHLALQTHDNLGEIQLALSEAVHNRHFPTKEEFLALPVREQRAFMCRAQVYRERLALPSLNRILKEATKSNEYDKRLLIYSLKLLSQTGVESSSKTLDRLLNLIEGDFSPEIRLYAAKALSQVEFDPNCMERKRRLVRAVSKEKDILVRCALIKCLGTYLFSSQSDNELILKIISFSTEDEDPLFLRSLAFTLTVLPDENALVEASRIVNGSTWKDFALLPTQYVREGDYKTYPYKPNIYHSPMAIKRIISERLVQLHKDSLMKSVEATYKEFQKNPSDFEDLQQLKHSIESVLSGRVELRLISFPIFLPKNKVLLRGINARKGEDLLNQAFNDLFIKGAGSSDLSVYGTYKEGTWAKSGQIFSTIALSDVMQGYFDKDGVLLTIDSATFNEMTLRRDVKLEVEKQLNPVFYSTIKHHMISQLFISKAKEAELRAIEAVDLNLRKVENRPISAKERLLKIAKRQLERKSPTGTSLKNRVFYFEPEGNLEAEIRRMMKEQGLQEATIDEIVKENIQRAIMRKLLAEEYAQREFKGEDDLAECLAFAAKIHPMVIFENPENHLPFPL